MLKYHKEIQKSADYSKVGRNGVYNLATEKQAQPDQLYQKKQFPQYSHLFLHQFFSIVRKITRCK